MTEEQKKPEIWTPPEAIDENTRRMAWLLFLEVWKQAASNKFAIAFTHGTLPAWAEKEYVNCLAVAKVVRAKEAQTTVRFEPDEPGG